MRAIGMMSFVLFAAAALHAADFAGKWIIDGDVQGNPVSLACVLTQAGG